MKRILAVMLFAVLNLVAADISGKWSGSFDMTNPATGETRPGQVHMSLKQEGGKITGTAGPSPEQQWPLTGTITGTTIAWEVKPEEGAAVKFKLTLDGDRMHGTADLERGEEKRSAKVDVTREK